MLFLNSLRQFARDMASQKLRTALTVFGVVWGTVAVTVLLAFGDAYHHRMKVSWLGLGENIVICWPTQTSLPWHGMPRGRPIRLTDADIDAVRQEVPEITAVTGEYASSRRTATVGRKVLVPSLVGTGPIYSLMRNMIPRPGGRFIDPLDMRDRKRVLFLGDELAHDLFGDAEPVGETVHLGGVPFLVVGVLQHKLQDSNYSGPDHSKAVIPGSTYKAFLGERFVDNFIFQVAAPEDVEAATRKMIAVLGRRHNFDPADEEAILMWDTTGTMVFLQSYYRIFQGFLALLGTLTLVVAGIGVSNIMHVVVEERTSEIGLKVALGAKRRWILGQFLLETCLVTVIGGALGFAIAWGLCAAFPSLGLERFVGQPSISARIALGTVTVLGTISFLAGYFPARTASRLHPVEALKM